MIPYVRGVLHPELYHGRGKEAPYFEGWYFKLVDRPETRRYAFIPGIFKHQDPGKSHCFVQVLDGNAGRSWYHRYPASEFWAAEDALDVRIGDNRFTRDRIWLDIHRPEQQVSGELAFGQVTHWQGSPLSPGAMGWFGWLPIMECYHGVVSLDHAIEGQLTVDGHAIDLTGGRGYMEKDWGRSFPAGWVWLQTNHLDAPGASLLATVAVVPWRRHYFPGAIAALWYGGKLHRLATYTGARVRELVISTREVQLVIEGRRDRLEIVATRSQGGILHGPSLTEMSPRVAESLTGEIKLRYLAGRGQRKALVFEGAGRNAGVEVNGDLRKLLRPLHGVLKD
ncbi:MAG: hypothetical protein GXY76_10525 [Chloroflexi bacterium]|nr:hypothetical protein [Chloroflexota bacterium]